MPAGVIAVRVVGPVTTMLVAETPANVTVGVVPAWKFTVGAAVIVTCVTSATGPDGGAMLFDEDTAVYVKLPASDPLPPGVVTMTAAAPGVPAGVVAVSVVAVATATPVAALPPTVTVVFPATKFVPVIVIRVPPLAGPDAGVTPGAVTPVTVGTPT